MIPVVAPNGSHGGLPTGHGSIQPKRRTTIATQTGEWSLGKTIGAGSMGKVKLAKNLENGEQVCSCSLLGQADRQVRRQNRSATISR